MSTMSSRDHDRTDLSGLVDRARDGDMSALGQLLGAVRDNVYRLALRMTACPSDAEDATQEILIKTMARLDKYRGDAAVTTWVYRIAVNHLLDRKKSRVEQLGMSFEDFAADLRDGLAEPSERSEPDLDLLAREVKRGCTLAMLTCLERDLRIAYVLGEILDLPAPMAASICSISEAAQRKRLSRARHRIREFVERNCGLVNPDGAACRCRRRVSVAIATGRIVPSDVRNSASAVDEAAAELDMLYDAGRLMRSHPDYHAPERVTEQIVQLVRSGRFRVFE
jgi:RNA polymerase sigma factor (sigma-70 family)